MWHSSRGCWLLPLLVGATAVVMIVPASAGISRSGAGSGTQFGVHQDLNYDGYDWRRAKNIAAAASIGAQISRNSLLWSNIESTRGTYDWSIPDSVVADLRANGIEPLFVIVGSPSWANATAPETPDARFYVPTQKAAFSAWVSAYVGFVKKAVARYKGRVTKWEVWNEENEHYTWKPAPSITQYAQ